MDQSISFISEYLQPNEAGEIVFKDRLIDQYKRMVVYIRKVSMENLFFVEKNLLAQALIDYFVDIKRLKTFHGILHTNEEKITAYTAYWILKRKPIQAREQISDERFRYINELFVVESIWNHFDSFCDIKVNDGVIERIKCFRKELFYYFKYRNLDPQSIELMLTSFRSALHCDTNY